MKRQTDSEAPKTGAAGSRDIPVDATVVGIVDDQEIDESLA